MSFTSIYSPIEYINRISRCNVESARLDSSGNASPKAMPRMNIWKACRTGDTFYRKQDVEMAWTELQNGDYTRNHPNKYSNICSVVQESHTISGTPETVPIIKSTPTKMSSTLKHSPSTRSSNANPYRKTPGKPRHVYFKQFFDTTTKYQTEPLNDSIMFSMGSNKNVSFPSEIKALEDSNEEPTTDITEQTQMHLPPYIEQKLNKNGVVSADSNLSSQLDKNTCDDSMRKSFKQKTSENKYVNQYPRCEFTIIEIEPPNF